MNLKIGTIIKQLRQQNNVTQEQLANTLYVSPQAISRWESEICYPDIEFLPALADFFSVSIDELLGYKLSERAETLENIKKELSRLAEVGTDQEKLCFAREAFVKFPNDAKIKVYLAACLSNEWNSNREESLYREAETLCLSVIDECHDEDIRYEAVFTLSTMYADSQKPEKAKAILNLLAPMKYCREFVLSCGIGDDNLELYKQDAIDKLADGLGTSITNYAVDDSLPNDPSTWDNKIEMLSIANQLYSMIYGDNLMFYHVRLSRNYWFISTYQIAQNKIAETLVSLEKMCYHAIEYDKSYINNHGKYYTSIFTNKLVYPEPNKDFHELREHTECHYLLERLQHNRYDCIRQDPCFISVVEKLSQFAK